jgi:hypothetical protein
MWERMLDRIADFRTGDVALGQLVADLRGLVIEADPHDSAVRDAFERQWARIDGEHELRTELWAPAGAASDHDLALYLEELQAWVITLVRSSSTAEHG